MDFKSLSAEETQEIAAKIARQFMSGDKVIKGGIIALIGDLGAGKTTFTQGFAKALSVTDKILSPTFVLQRQHPIPESHFVLYHLDLYRLENESNFNQLDLEELFDLSDKIVIIEWAEKITTKLPLQTKKITFQRISDLERRITIN